MQTEQNICLIWGKECGLNDFCYDVCVQIPQQNKLNTIQSYRKRWTGFETAIT
jgi:hypothetical protein